MKRKNNNPDFISEKVVSVEHLRQLARERRSCYHLYPCFRLPAAVMLNMQASILLKFIDSGNLFIYPKRRQKGDCHV